MPAWRHLAGPHRLASILPIFGRRGGRSCAPAGSLARVLLSILPTVLPIGVICVLPVASTAHAQEPIPLPADTAEAPQGPEVKDVRFPGAESLDHDLLEDAIVTQATRCRSAVFVVFCTLGLGFAQTEAYLDSAEVPQDAERLERLYETWGYPEATVTARVLPEGDEVVVEFAVFEGAPIVVESVAVKGLETLQPAVELARPLPLAEGDAYALPRLEATRNQIRAAFAERGHPYAEVTISGDVDERANTARVVLTVEPGPPAFFGPVTVVPEAPIDAAVVRERIAYEPGEPYRPSRFAQTEAELYALPIVETATAEPVELTGAPTTIPTRVIVAARKPSGVEIEGTLSGTECFEAAVFWRSRYFLGGPRLFSIGVGAANILAGTIGGGFPCTSSGEGEFAELDYFVRADLRQPWPGDPHTAVLVRAFFQRESAPQVFVWRGYGGELGIARALGRGLTTSLSYAPRRQELDAAGIYFCGNFGVCTDEGIDELSEFKWLAPVELLAVWQPFPSRIQALRARERDVPEWVRPPEPVLRYQASGALQAAAAPTGSDYDYVRGILEGSTTRVFGTTFELGGRLRLGALTGADVLPPQIRLYTGGVNTVRGVSQNMLGPKFLIVDADEVGALGCALAPDGCPPSTRVEPDQVNVRPTGGDAVLGASIEARRWVSRTVQLALFLDYGTLRRDLFTDPGGFPVDDSESLLSPGIGVRVLTDLGPLRVDVGYNPSGSHRYPLFTEDPATSELVFLGDVVYDPFDHGDPGALERFWRRLQLHVAIGQPF